MLNEGDKVKILSMTFSRENYPWIPDLVGKTGTISKIELFPGDSEGTNYHVRMDEPFMVDRPPEGEHAFGYVPDMSRAERGRSWVFCDEDVVKQ